MHRAPAWRGPTLRHRQPKMIMCHQKHVLSPLSHLSQRKGLCLNYSVQEQGSCISVGCLSRLTATGELLVVKLCTTVDTALRYVSGYCKHAHLSFGGLLKQVATRGWNTTEKDVASFVSTCLCLHFHESVYLVLNYNKWRIWRSKVIWFLKESCDRQATWVLFKSVTSGKLLSYCTDASPVKTVRNWQSYSVLLGGAIQVIPHQPKPAEQREFLGRVPAVSLWQQMERTHPSDKKIICFYRIEMPYRKLFCYKSGLLFSVFTVLCEY